jgi:Cu2+-exporting ATPase
MTTLNCDHCLLSFPEKDAVRDEVDGRQKVFCCNGCLGVYRLIHEEGLDEFYQRRQGWTPGPPEHTEVTARSFEGSVRSIGDHREIDIHLSGIRCASCIWLIEHFLSKNKGIKEIRVNYATHRARIRWLPEETSLDSVLERIMSLGYVPRPYAVSQAEESLEREKKDLLIRLGTASFLSMQLMIYTTALYAGYFQGIEPSYRKVFELIALALATPVMFYCGYPFLKNTVLGMRNRTFNMDTLIFSGSFSAYAYSVIVIFIGGEVYFDTSAMIITLILLGRFIESGAKARATRSVSALFSLQPKEARLIKAGESGMLTVPVSALRVGDRIEVIPGERVPIDSLVVDGTSEVDESMLTGEAMPVKKVRGKEVFGGTMNLNGRLLVEVKRTGDDTVLSQVIRAVEDAQSRRAPIQKVADRVVVWFVPAIVVISTSTFLFWFMRGSPTTALMNAISVMVVACPCALGLATPLAVLMGSTLLASKGILVKGGDIIEAIAHADYISFDKTGTLTAGMPALITTVNYGMEERSLRVLAASIERNSEHSIARALCKGISESDLFAVDEFRARPGRGVEGVLNGERLAIGNASFLESFGAEITEDRRRDFSSLSAQGNTVIGLALGRELKGWFVISDELRPEAPELVEDLRRYGYHMALITGDHRSVAENIGSKAGISTIIAEVLPVQKAGCIREIKESGHRVVMVGDGINDAPALMEANVGVAVGSATDIAIESADVVLMRPDLRLILRLVRISGKIFAIIRENLFWAFSYNLIAIPLAVSGKLHPIISAAFMALSSLIVVGNSLRLHRVK